MDLFTFLLVALATYRATRLVIYEDGPFNVLWRLRYKLGRLALRYRRAAWIAKGIGCPWCVSFWVAPCLCLLTLNSIGMWLVAGLAASALASLAMRYLEEDD